MAEPQIVYRVAAHLSSKGDLAKSLTAKAAAVSSLSSSLSGATARMDAFGRANISAVSASAAAIGKYAAAAGGLAVGAGIGALVTKGASFNATMERAQNTIAGTLQLFNHSAGAADQLGTNVKVAGAALQELNRIADASPGELKDVQQLFTAMLPGARAATGEMKRILALTQQAAVLTPTFGTDFHTVGSQLGRALTGSAGAEMEVFQKTRTLLLEAGQTMDSVTGKGKIFAKSMTNPFAEDFTKKFNQLQIGDRLAMFEKVMGKGSELTKLYEQSWEGASSSFVSGWRKIAGRFTQPMFLSMKAALVKASNDDNAFFGKNNQAKLASAGSILGGLLNKSFVKVLQFAERAIDSIANNWQGMANTAYHAMQIGAGLIKAAFAFGFTRMVVGAAALAAATAGKAVGGVGRGLSKGFGMGKSAIGGIAKAIKGTREMVETITKGNPIANALGTVTALARGVSMLGMAALAAVPVLIVGAAAFGALSLGLVAVAGVGAYVASKWSELSASVIQGFREGTITMRPLIIAGMILWERLKLLGESFIGGQTGASMFQTAINLAARAVTAVSDGVATLAEVAAGFLRMIAGASSTFSAITDPLGHVAAAKQAAAYNAANEYADNFQGTPAQLAMDEKYAQLIDYANSFNTSTADKLETLAGSIESAASAWRSTGLKDLDFKTVDDLTKKADDFAAALVAGDTKTTKAPRGPAVNIGTLVQQFDLRGEDPDRAMIAWVDPIERLARTPGGSTLDVGGFG